MNNYNIFLEKVLLLHFQRLSLPTRLFAGPALVPYHLFVNDSSLQLRSTSTAVPCPAGYNLSGRN